MGAYEKLATYLEKEGIAYDVVEHPAAFTTEEADRYIEGYEGVRTKSMFLTNKKKTSYYLVIMDDAKSLDMDSFKDIVHTNRIRMASEQSLQQKMDLAPGLVSPFGLLNNKEKDIQVYFDQEILDKPVQTFHPNDNTKTLFVKTEDIIRFIERLGFEVHKVIL
ncbi:YbaK/prolyl-tRNA synthetase associated domain-containing protein [Streptococcus porcinus]|uniref:YbaK/prolyl-tRNA synthetase associated domain-containing protein n=1 Tax=Streptococcus porcinus TaxID=1340 RepID=A0A4U9XXC3_STRPO|nr:prolyl-tRNA synthetase associated domain-containing protein [Streptococcus porcinus]VTS18434.1 YbaK/prolyl-tRNA synthetase associated domain-containing protein [Streptococcus porcinus]VTT42074.1 YbaK/prolyl-tRNA synthetase associated domain-containing protein [Streptococcus porcinus]VTT43505.1 YbaK/prolyl-tRNA synthetase associated domain-containing protein [Streptococcus porcinus]